MAKKAGVGYKPDKDIATWVGADSVLDNVPINFSANTFKGRYGHDDAFGSPQGFANENHGNNEKALINWFNAQPQSHKDQWTGKPTQWEQYDLAFTQSQTGSAFYNTYWLAFEPGGTKETAIVVDESNWTEHGPKFPRGVRLGLQTKPSPIEGFVNWYDVKWKPANVPDPLPPPKIGESAEFWSRAVSGFTSGKVKSVRNDTQKITFTPDAGGKSVTHSLDDEGRGWRLKAGGSQPSPVPTPTPAPSPTPSPIPQPIPKPAPTNFNLSENARKTLDEIVSWIPKTRPNQRNRAQSMVDEIKSQLEK